MTDQEIRIEIGTACGWVPDKSWVVKGNVKTNYNWRRGEERLFALPNYPEDLNAMHEAEEKLPATGGSVGVSRLRYYNVLIEIVARDGGATVEMAFLILHATDRQRAEALLKTWNKWKD